MYNLSKRQVLFVVVALLGFAGCSDLASAQWNKAEELPKLKQPIPSSNPMTQNQEAIGAGKKLFSKFCVQCHGVNADGQSATFEVYAGDLRKFPWGYGEFIAIVLNGRPDKQMPPWKEYLNINQISQIGSFLEQLAVKGANWK